MNKFFLGCLFFFQIFLLHAETEQYKTWKKCSAPSQIYLIAAQIIINMESIHWQADIHHIYNLFTPKEINRAKAIGPYVIIERKLNQEGLETIYLAVPIKPFDLRRLWKKTIQLKQHDTVYTLNKEH